MLKQLQNQFVKKLVQTHLKIKLTTNYSLTNHIHLNVCKQMNDVKYSRQMIRLTREILETIQLCVKK